MKKSLSIIILVLFVIFPHVGVAFSEDLNDEVDKQLSELNIDELKSVGDELIYEYFDVDVKGLIKMVVNNQIDINTFFRLLVDSTFVQIKNSVSVCATIIAICVACSMINGFGNEEGSTGSIINTVCYFCVLSVILTVSLSLINDCKTLIGKLSDIMNAVFPILLTVLTLLGGKTTLGFFSPLMAILQNGIVNVINTVVLSLFCCCNVLTYVSNVSGVIKLNNLRLTVKSVCNWILGLVFGLFVTLCLGGGLITKSIDNVSVKAVKYTFQSYIPIIGGYLSDGFDVITSGAVLIKNSVGVVGLIVIFLICISPVIKTVLSIIGLKLCSGIIESFADNRVVGLIKQSADNLLLLTSIILSVVFLFFVTVIVFLGCTNLGVI